MLFSFTSLRTRFNHAAGLRPADATYRKTGELKVADLSDNDGASSVIAPSAAKAPPAAKSLPATKAPPATKVPSAATTPDPAAASLQQKTKRRCKNRDPRDPKPVSYANYYKDNHVLGTYPGPINQDRFLPNYVLHNTLTHNYDDYHLGKFLNTQQHIFHLIVARAGLPPIRIARSWV
ncbi:hypothetical protein F4818DRAFT_416849 [Hypoxylon cercidicola]|nr:hypothetical protein F4818DRAFT_416849 [Hypoxylon cercidicola]